MQVYLVGVFIFALVVAVFAVQNAQTVSIRFLTWEFKDISLVLIILGSAALGAVMMAFISTIKQIKNFRKLKEMQRENKRLQEQLEKLAEELQQSAGG
ncbi:LapA family protein [Calderihabitans maritimus]|uniref:Lipopolysaccharide assembly protein A domain-containing protein n=1 Tax=Calderihabitans maritimus TaxID=1246530 RepID=A0A1Z5HTV1_9FIRM|nr:LapA family protein [Calderihabitans maritimus]GAW92700.1 hypothetical protein Moth_1682 [Calderihabitans maritimus]